MKIHPTRSAPQNLVLRCRAIVLGQPKTSFTRPIKNFGEKVAGLYPAGYTLDARRIEPVAILVYEEDGVAPVEEWLTALDDRQGRIAVAKRLDRVQMGLLGDHKSVGAGVFELRLDVGPGYRVYFGREGSALVVLLAGGTKRTQHSDIRIAQDRWAKYKRRQL